MPNNIRFHERRAQEVLFPLHRAFLSQEALFADEHVSELPQNQYVPEGVRIGSEEHVLFLFFVTLITLRSNSRIGFKKSLTLYAQHPELFSKQVMYMHPADVIICFRDARLAFQNSWAGYWIDCAQTLFRRFNGDPLAVISAAQQRVRTKNIVDGFLLLKKELKRRKEPCFSGYGAKLFSLFALFCEELGLVRHIADSVPVDVHLQSICISTGVISSKNGPVIDSTECAEFLRERLCRFCRHNDMSMFVLSSALWLLGRSGCTVCAQTEANRMQRRCPVFDLCIGRPATWPYWKKGKWFLKEPWRPKGHVQLHLFPSE